MSVFYKARHKKKVSIQQRIENVIVAVLVYPAIGFTLAYRWATRTPMGRAVLFTLFIYSALFAIVKFEEEYFLHALTAKMSFP